MTAAVSLWVDKLLDDCGGLGSTTAPEKMLQNWTQNNDLFGFQKRVYARSPEPQNSEFWKASKKCLTMCSETLIFIIFLILGLQGAFGVTKSIFNDSSTR